jgi:hypothetical protein
VYADLLIGRDARLRGPLARDGAARAWLVTALRENRGWDRITTDLLEKETLDRQELEALLADVQPESNASDRVGTPRAVSAGD